MSPSLSDALRDPERLNALCQTGLLDTLPEEAFDRYIRLAKAILDAPVLLISLVDRERQFFKAHSGLPEAVGAAQETPLTHSFCQHVVHREEPLVIFDARREALVQDNAAVRDLGVVAYLGVPLRSLSGRVLGSFCVIDMKPRIWTADDIAHAHDLAAAVSSEIQLRETRFQLEAAQAARARSIADAAR